MPTVHIEWEHGDADANTDEKYSFKSTDDMDAFLRFIYDLRSPILTNGSWGKDYWHFQDGHYQTLDSWVNEIDAKHGGKFGYLLPRDIYASNHIPTVNHIHVRIRNKKHYIVWLDLLHKSENIISLSDIGTESELSTGNICGYEELFGIKNPVRDHHLDDIVGKPTGKFPNTVYPKIKVKLFDCKIDFGSVSKYNFDYNSFQYKLLYLITDERLMGKLHSEHCLSGMNGFDPDFEKKFSHGKYDGLSYYEIKR